jgi:hypothetical protein
MADQADPMQEDDESAGDDASEPHWCVDCEGQLLAADQQRSWDFCDFCGQAVCAQCDRVHTCADMLRKKPRNW